VAMRTSKHTPGHLDVSDSGITLVAANTCERCLSPWPVLCPAALRISHRARDGERQPRRQLSSAGEGGTALETVSGAVLIPAMLG
jgi:hypothetical protein